MIDVHHSVDLVSARDLVRELGAFDIEIAGDNLAKVLVQDVGRGEAFPVGKGADRISHSIQLNGHNSQG